MRAGCVPVGTLCAATAPKRQKVVTRTTTTTTYVEEEEEEDDFPRDAAGFIDGHILDPEFRDDAPRWVFNPGANTWTLEQEEWIRRVREPTLVGIEWTRVSGATRADKVVHSFKRIVVNALHVKKLTSFAGSVLYWIQDRYKYGAVATGKEVTKKEYAALTASSRWTTMSLLGGRTE